MRRLSRQIDLLLVVGARYSSNSNRLREAGEQNGLPAYLIEDEGEIEPKWLKNKGKIGITAGASTPEILVQGVLAKLRSYGKLSVREMRGRQETIHFSLPKSEYL